MSTFRLINFGFVGGEEGKGLCTGDEGAPLVCEVFENSQHYFQAGIAVGSFRCGEDFIPNIFLNVAKYRDWIDRKIEVLGLETKTYTY